MLRVANVAFRGIRRVNNRFGFYTVKQSTRKGVLEVCGFAGRISRFLQNRQGEKSRIFKHTFDKTFYI